MGSSRRAEAVAVSRPGPALPSAGAPAASLAAELRRLLRAEHGALGDFLVALAGFDRARGWVDLGYPSLFAFLRRELGLSTGAAYYRKLAAELVQRCPEVVEPLRDGRLCITSVVELAKVLTPENRADVLPRFFHRSKREARAVAVELRPVAVVPKREVVTRAAPPAAASSFRLDEAQGRLAAPDRPREGASGGGGAPAGPRDGLADASVATAAAGEPGSANSFDGVGAAPLHAGPSAASPARAPDAVDPLTADLRRLHITVSRRFLEKLESAREALSHARPLATAEQVLEAALDVLLAAEAKKRGGPPGRGSPPDRGSTSGGRPGPGGGTAAVGGTAPDRAPAPDATLRNHRQPALDARPPPPRSARSVVDLARGSARHIPAEVRRFVWQRDRGCCQWPLHHGGICGSRRRVEIDHIQPLALGGTSDPSNLRLLCRFHNGLAARAAYGDRWMDRYQRPVRPNAPPPPPPEAPPPLEAPAAPRPPAPDAPPQPGAPPRVSSG